MASEQREREVVFGETVYDADGNELGRVRAYDDAGFYVTSAEGISTLTQAESKAGEKTLMWRCWNCGEVGRIDEIPDSCPSCGAPGEDLYYWQED